MAPGTSITVEPGPGAHRALIEEVARRRGGDPLTPLTIVVPSRRAGLAARRELGAFSPTGIANVRFVTAGWLAELLAGPTLAASGKHPLHAAAAREALRAELARNPGRFGARAASPRTLDAIARTFEHLRSLPPQEREPVLRLAEQHQPWLARLFANTRKRLAGYYDAGDLLRAVRGLDAASDALAEVGPILAWCPRPADRHAATILDALGPAVTRLVPHPDAAVAPTEILTVTDPDEEARAVVRCLLRWAADGIAWHRMAVAYPVTHPYAELLHQHLDAAGIGHNGPTTRTLAATPPGRLLTGALSLSGGLLARDEVLAWLTSSPVQQRVESRTTRAHAATWDLLSRQAGVVEGVEQWTERLAILAEIDHADTHGHLRDEDRAEIKLLAAFVADLARHLDPPPSGSSWAALATWAGALFRRYTPPKWHRRRGLSAAEATDNRLDADIDATTAILDALAALHELDEIGEPPTLEAFRDAIGLALQTPFGRLGAFGTGVFVIPLHEAATLPLDAVVVVGAVEGTLPRRFSVDPVLDTAVAAALEPWTDSPAEDLEAQRNEFLGAVAAGRRHRMVSLPRAELDSNRIHQPSRWLLDTTEALVGRRLRGRELLGGTFAELPLHAVASYTAALSDQPPVNVQERRIAMLADAAGKAEALATHPAALAHRGLGRGIEAVSARATGAFGPYTGKVDPFLVPIFDPERAMSPTSLEHDAACPRRYLLGRLLHFEELDLPEAVVDLSALDRGSLLHEILERYIGGLLADPPLDRSLDRLLDVAEAVFADYNARGLTGRRLGWANARREIRRDLTAIHARDDRTPMAVELPFGLDEAPALEVPLADGSVLAFRGRIDRVDRDTNGALVVTDYKTGSDSAYTRIEESTVEGGTKLQLPMYALAAMQAFRSDEVAAYYWFITAKGKYRRRGYALDRDRFETFRTTVAALAGQITEGLFPGRPIRPRAGRQAEDNCRICPFDSVCPDDRDVEWATIETRPELAAYVALSAPPAEDL